MLDIKSLNSKDDYLFYIFLNVLALMWFASRLRINELELIMPSNPSIFRHFKVLCKHKLSIENGHLLPLINDMGQITFSHQKQICAKTDKGPFTNG